MAKKTVLDHPSVDQLSKLVEESTRSSKDGARFFIEPASNTLSRALSKRHHIVFGRRGSGKSSLLNKVPVDAQSARLPIVYIDMEQFKGHSYPDVLVSVLLSTFTEFQVWLNGVAVHPASKTSFWKKIVGALPLVRPIKDPRLNQLGESLEKTIRELDELLHSPVEADRKQTKAASKKLTEKTRASASVKTKAVDFGVEGADERSLNRSSAVEDAYRHEKIATLHRNILRYRDLLSKIASVGGSAGFIILDDLYHIRSEDQVDVVDYFHRIAKGTGMWLKVGTIRHRTKYYEPGDPPKGMKIGDDCDEIDLDVTLEKYQLTKSFLVRVLDQFAKECGIKLSSIMTDGARDRLVIGSGGVARDFLSIFRRAIEIAKERIASGDLARGEKLGAEDVNKAAGENDNYKQTEFARDTDDQDAGGLRDFFLQISDFCVEKNKTNCFLVEKDTRDDKTEMIAELVDLKLLHHCNARVTVRSKVGKIYDAYMLDIAQYTGERARRNLDMMEFWDTNGAEKLRRASIILVE